jgi:hypothetical protein
MGDVENLEDPAQGCVAGFKDRWLWHMEIGEQLHTTHDFKVMKLNKSKHIFDVQFVNFNMIQVSSWGLSR